LLSINTDNMEL